MNSSHKRGIFFFVLVFILTLASTASLNAQDGYLSGMVIDSATHEPLAFVSIVYNSSGQGVVTNLEGNFRIPKKARSVT